jgi:hypothetical protein
LSKEFPKWAAEEISKASLGYLETWKFSGYPLEIDKAKGNVDVQFYDRLPEGRYIVTLETSDKEILNSLELGQVYMFEFKVYSAKLSDKLVNLLRDEYNVIMDTIYRFETVSVEKIE